MPPLGYSSTTSHCASPGLTVLGLKLLLPSPLALLGLPLPMFMTHKALNLLYQFWIHTETIGDLGPLEYILNTPSHHRLHHRPGANVNYAGVLIIWDRMFGTFRAEGEGQLDRYGLGKPLNTFDPVRANFEYIRRASESIGWVRPMLPWEAAARPKWSFRPLDVFRPLEYEASGERRRDADRRSNAIRGRGRPALWYRPALWAPPEENAARQKYVGSMPPFRHRGAIEASYLGAHLLVLLVGHHCFEELMRQPGSTSDPATYALALWLLASLARLDDFPMEMRAACGWNGCGWRCLRRRCCSSANGWAAANRPAERAAAAS